MSIREAATSPPWRCRTCSSPKCASSSAPCDDPGSIVDLSADKGAAVGILDGLKRLVSGHKKEVSDGIDKVADVAKDKVGHEKEVDKAVDAVEGALGIDDTSSDTPKRPS
ncbi:MAG: antitoxin [Acidimicrobiia bacterium]|nr:antitoxin [Acidimicrobiia bacterium]